MNERKKVLIVEDTKMLRMSLEVILQETYDVAGAADGNEALEILREFTPDIILLDLMLPYPLDGYSLLRLLKSNPSTNMIPVIIISGMSGEDKIIQGLELGANDFLVKPIKSKELLLKIRNLTGILQVNEEKVKQKRLLATKNFTNSDSKDFFEDSFEAIVEKLSEDDLNTIPSIAKRMSVSVSTLERMIKAKYNMTPKQYITEIKLMKAEVLLRQGNTSVKQVSFQSGFNSVAYFCHCFKKKYGKPPKAYSSSISN
ncbi:response regulator [Sediminibacterium salmoneum]|jgi:DNA-binding response OmpR family regulator|uniref:response regulator n=1 Tax=Sediminibacterium salmoneum TaxID=426421 RepID=UPI00047A5520|nr:response regulator [Sediminibacterium salmoneum]